MKRLLFYAAAALLGSLSMVGCSPTEKEFDGSFLYSGSGEWGFTADYGDGPNEMRHKFNADGSGWEKNITLEQLEEQRFTWSLSGERLTFIHNIQTGGSAPEDCTVMTLTATKLVYRRESGGTVSCTKL